MSAAFACKLPLGCVHHRLDRCSDYNRSSPSPRSDSDLCSHAAARSPGLPLLKVSTSVIHVIHGLLFSYRPWRDGKGWVGLLGWPTADTLPTEWSSINHRSGTGHWKSDDKARQNMTTFIAATATSVQSLQLSKHRISIAISAVTVPWNQ